MEGLQMKKEINAQIINLLAEREQIDEKNREIYIYGFNILIQRCIYTILFLGISFLLKMPVEGIIFMIVYSNIRRYSGGYHCNNNFGCYLCSCFVMVFALVLMYLGRNTTNIYMNLLVLIISGSIIVILAPIDNKNKLLDKIEIKLYKQKTLIRVMVTIFITILLENTLNIWIYNIINVIFLLIIVMMLLGLKGSHYITRV